LSGNVNGDVQGLVGSLRWFQ